MKEAYCCARCGQALTSRGVVCSQCRFGGTSAEMEALHLNMGPWMVRGAAWRFCSGISGRQFAAMLQAGHIDAETVVRGPATQQLWRRADQVPGVKALLEHPTDKELLEAFRDQDPDFLGLTDEAGRRRTITQLLADVQVCPACGVAAGIEDTCADCGLQYGQPQALNQMLKSLGPWYVRLENRPWAPGMRLAALQRMIAGKTINRRTPVRGPGSLQLWQPAGEVRGLTRKEEATPHPGRLGLKYHTGEMRAKAEARLFDAVRVPPPKTTPPLEQKAVRARTRERKARQAGMVVQEQWPGSVKLASVAGVLLAIGLPVLLAQLPEAEEGVVVVEVQAEAEAEDAAALQRSQRREPSRAGQLRGLSRELDDLVLKVDLLREYEMTQLMRASFQQDCEMVYTRARQAIEDDNLEEAQHLVARLEEGLARLEVGFDIWADAEASRQSVNTELAAAERARRQAQQTSAPEVLAEGWADIETRLEAVREACHGMNNRFDVERQAWDDMHARLKLLTETYAQMAEAAVNMDIISALFPWLQARLDTPYINAELYAADSWREALVAWESARAAEASGDLAAAAEQAQVASAHVLEADSRVLVEVGYGQLCFRAGYEACSAMFDVSSGQGLTSERRQALAEDFAALRLDVDPLAALPERPHPYFGHVQDVMIRDTRPLIEQGGAAYVRAYEFGFHLAILENGLRLGTMGSRIRDELVAQVGAAVSTAAADQYPDAVIDRLNRIGAALQATEDEGRPDPSTLADLRQLIEEAHDLNRGFEIFLHTRTGASGESLQSLPAVEVPEMLR